MFLCYFRRENSNAFGISPDILTQCDGFIHQNIHEYKDIKKDENVILRIAWQAWPTGQKKRDDATRMSWLSPPDIEVLPSSSSRLGVSSPTPLIDDRIDKSRDEKAWDCGTFPFSSWHLLVTPFTEKKKIKNGRKTRRRKVGYVLKWWKTHQRKGRKRHFNFVISRHTPRTCMSDSARLNVTVR